MNIHEEKAWRHLIHLGAQECELGGKHALNLSPIRIMRKDKLRLFVQAVLAVVGRSGANRRHVDRSGCPVYIVTDFYTVDNTDRKRHDAETKALLTRLREQKELPK
jgi:hypothetical protein